MSKFRELILEVLQETDNNAIYCTYYHTSPNEYFINLSSNFQNKPRGGLWGCHGSEWKDWCEYADYPIGIKHFEWKLKPNTKIFTLNTQKDFEYLVKNYNILNEDSYYIDFLKLSNNYDAIEVTENAIKEIGFYSNRKSLDPDLNTNAFKKILSYGLDGWDVPSICVFNPKNTVEIIKIA